MGDPSWLDLFWHPQNFHLPRRPPTCLLCQPVRGHDARHSHTCSHALCLPVSFLGFSPRIHLPFFPEQPFPLASAKSGKHYRSPLTTTQTMAPASDDFSPSPPTPSLLLIRPGEGVVLGDGWKQKSPLSCLLFFMINPEKTVRLLLSMALSRMWSFQLLFVPSWVLVTSFGVAGLPVTLVPFLNHVDSYLY